MMAPGESRFPLKPGSPEVMVGMRCALLSAGFDEATLCRELQISRMSELGRARWAELDFNERPEALRTWAGIFLFGEHGSRAAVERIFGATVLEHFLSVGLLQGVKGNPDQVVSPVFLYPAGGFLLASDRHDDPDQPGSSRDAEADVVFPGLFGGTLRFLELLPEIKGGDALDLCGGCGIGALKLAQTARTAVSADLTARATQFADFNAQLNAVPHVEAACGDLYQAVSGRQFDLITAHPPYVPTLGDRMIYRDAGDVGEDITRRIVAGLAAHLRPEGRALILCQGRDTEEGPFEQRVRGWLGEGHEEFDVLFGLQATKTLDEEAWGMARRVHPPTSQELAGLVKRFRNLGTRQFVYGALAIYRHRAPTAHATSRVRLASEARFADFDRLIRWHRRRSSSGYWDWLVHAPLRLSPSCELRIRHVVQDGTLVPAEFLLEVDRPFIGAMRVDGWVTPLIARLNSSTTPAEVFSSAKSADELPPGFELNDFRELVSRLLERGYLLGPD